MKRGSAKRGASNKLNCSGKAGDRGRFSGDASAMQKISINSAAHLDPYSQPRKGETPLYRGRGTTFRLG